MINGLTGVALDVLDDNLLRLRADLQRENAREERLAVHLVRERIVVEHHGLGRLAAAIQNGGDLAGLAEAAAAGAAERGARLDGELEDGFDVHGLVPSRKPRIIAQPSIAS
jgi:hypothetical protein